MQNLKLFLVASFLISFLACNNNTKVNKDKGILEEAFNYHTQAMQLEKVFIKNQLQLVSRRNSIQVQGRALTDQELKWLEDEGKVQLGYEEWQKSIIEVPGFEHDHDHGEHGHHHHHHAPSVNLTAEDMLETQKALLDRIIELNDQAKTLLK